MYKALSIHAQQIAQKYILFTLRGKLGRSVPVLLTEELRNCIDMILRYRKAARVSSKNPYLFGLPSIAKNKYKYLLACDLLRQYALECGAEKPETLRATELHKHIATICINYNLSENEISAFANFMGYSDKIHLSHYRQLVIEKEILEVSQYLEAAQGNSEDNDSDYSDSTIFDNENTNQKTYSDEFNITTSRQLVQGSSTWETSYDNSDCNNNIENDKNLENFNK
ncbi:uncharacterized protein LOC109503590 [Harpegnathos saltator]|uniref:uncharacterized protein LOC109503590 n=1 Tax=Harpegnathos saltator TaxID=610380 RepID=UPI000DBED994|nr:uncharacterized protein LOC109503590 [Harpegnathos saltator]